MEARPAVTAARDRTGACACSYLIAVANIYAGHSGSVDLVEEEQNAAVAEHVPIDGPEAALACYEHVVLGQGAVEGIATAHEALVHRVLDRNPLKNEETLREPMDEAHDGRNGNLLHQDQVMDDGQHQDEIELPFKSGKEGRALRVLPAGGGRGPSEVGVNGQHGDVALAGHPEDPVGGGEVALERDGSTSWKSGVRHRDAMQRGRGVLIAKGSLRISLASDRKSTSDASYLGVDSMAPQPHKSKGWHRVTAQSIMVSAALMFAFWVLLVGSVHRDDVIVGCVGVIAATAMLWLIARVNNLQFRFTLRDVMSGGRVPWNIVKDVSLVIGILLRDVFLRVPPRSVFSVCGFRTSKRNPQDIARRVLVTAYSSAAPNTIVLGVDYTESRILFHQLQSSEPDETMIELGARP